MVCNRKFTLIGFLVLVVLASMALLQLKDNSPGDQQMLEYIKAGDGARLAVLLLHDDADRENAYGPSKGLPDTKVGAFTQALYDEAKKNGWTAISMKNDWKRIFAFEQ